MVLVIRIIHPRGFRQGLLPPEVLLDLRRIGLAVGGGVLAIVGVTLALVAPGVNTNARMAATLDDATAQHERAVAMSAAGYSLLGIGAAAAVAGVVLVALPVREKSSATVSFNGSGILIRGTW